MMPSATVDMVGMAAASCVAGLCVILTMCAVVYLTCFGEKKRYHGSCQRPSRAPSRLSIPRSQIGHPIMNGHRWATIGSTARHESLNVFPPVLPFDVTMNDYPRTLHPRYDPDYMVTNRQSMGPHDVHTGQSAMRSGRVNYEEREGFMAFGPETDFSVSAVQLSYPAHPRFSHPNTVETRVDDVVNRTSTVAQQEAVARSANGYSATSHAIGGGNVNNNYNYKFESTSDQMQRNESRNNNVVVTNGTIDRRNDNSTVALNGIEESTNGLTDRSGDMSPNSVELDYTVRSGMIPESSRLPQRNGVPVPPPPPCPPPPLPM